MIAPQEPVVRPASERGRFRPDLQTLVTCLTTLTLVAGACSQKDGPAPSPAPPTGVFVNIAGSWVGTLSSSNLPARHVTLIVVQAGNCVDGVWHDDDGWTGAISGFASEDAYSGQISLERSDDAGRCTAVATVSGPVTDRTLRWSGSAFTAVGACTGPLPETVDLALTRQ